MSDAPALRASDAERQQVVEELSRQCAAGRLTLEEAEERMGEAWRARTLTELHHTLRELPVARSRQQLAAVPLSAGDAEARAGLRGHASCYAVVIGFLVVIWAITSPGGYFWPIWPALGWGLGLGLHAVGVRNSSCG